MSGSTKITIAVASILIVTGAVSPFLLRAGGLYWAKHRARQIFARYTVEERRDLNITPTLVTLPDVKTDAQSIDSAKLGDYIIRFPQPVTPAASLKVLRLTYPNFEVVILPPYSTVELDLLARQLNYKDGFDYRSAVFHARLDDLDNQHDLPSIKRYLLLMASKPVLACPEEFEGPDVRGFILSPKSGSHTTIAAVSIPAIHAACGVHFRDTGGLTPNDIHAFLAVLHFEQK